MRDAEAGRCLENVEYDWTRTREMKQSPFLTAVENWLCCGYLLQSFQRPLFMVLHCIALAWTHNLHDAM